MAGQPHDNLEKQIRAIGKEVGSANERDWLQLPQLLLRLERVAAIDARLSKMEHLLSDLHGMLSNQRIEKDWYTVRELAEFLDRSEFTVREWCRLGRVYASKQDCGRGNSKEWIVAADELRRIQNEGLLPLNQ